MQVVGYRGALVAALLGSVALVGSASSVLAQDPYYALSASGGVIAMNLPAFTTGIQTTGTGTFTPSLGGPSYGAMFEGKLTVGLGEHNGTAISLSGNIFGAIGGFGTSTITDTFTGPGTVIIPGYTTPGNSTMFLDSNSTSDSDASFDIDNTNPQTGTAGVAGAINTPSGATAGVNAGVYQQAGTGDSFVFGAGVTEQDNPGDTAAAYGFIAATDGGIFMGVGDITGLVITTTNSSSFAYLGGDLAIGATTMMNEGAYATLYAGPSYRLLRQQNDTTISIDIPESDLDGGTVIFPTLTIDRDETLDAHYMGGVAGANVTFDASEGVTVTLGGEGGAYYVMSSFDGTETYGIFGGSGVAGIPVNGDTVVNDTFAGLTGSTWAFSAKGTGSIGIDIAEQTQLTLGGMLGYLSAVPTVTRGTSSQATASYAAGVGDGDYDSTGGGGTGTTQPMLSYTDMWNWGLSVGVTGTF